MKKRIVTIVVLVVFLGGCASIGRDNVLFVTRTNVAIDFDIEPPTAAIGYKRDEFVLAPVDDVGRVLPVLTTAATRAGIFEFGASHSFVTGDAAILFGRHLLEDTKLNPEKEIKYSELKGAISEGLDGNEISGNSDKRSRFLFTTNTSLGLEVAWTTKIYPTSVSLGWKRKELAFVPLKHDKSDNSKSHLSSLLATAQASSNAGQQENTGITVGQAFATGFAATLMATHPAIRQAVGPAVVPNWDEAVKAKKEIEKQKAKVDAEKTSSSEQGKLVDGISKAFNAKTSDEKEQLVEQAVSLKLVPKDTSDASLVGKLRLGITTTDDDWVVNLRTFHCNTGAL